MFRAVWSRRAFNQMNLIIRNHPDHKEELAEALRELSATLSSAPGGAGESRAGSRRIAWFGPLVVYFRVFPADQTVRILSVHLRAPLF